MEGAGREEGGGGAGAGGVGGFGEALDARSCNNRRVRSQRLEGSERPHLLDSLRSESRRWTFSSCTPHPPPIHTTNSASLNSSNFYEDSQN